MYVWYDPPRRTTGTYRRLIGVDLPCTGGSRPTLGPLNDPECFPGSVRRLTSHEVSRLVDESLSPLFPVVPSLARGTFRSGKEIPHSGNRFLDHPK